MKVGIVVPYSWSYWGAVPEHAELKAQALQRIGIETRTIMGHDPPGSFTRVLHPRHGRHGRPPGDVIPIGRSVIVPANGALPNIILSPAAIPRIKRVLERERFDVLHLHEPMTPVVCTAVMAWARCPVVATFHASGGLGWLRPGRPGWGFLMERIDHRIAVSDAARDSAARWFPGDYEVIPNGVLIPPEAEPGGRENRIIGADPLMVRLALSRAGVSEDGIDALGFLSQDALTAELLAAKALVAPSLGGESFGMVLTRAFACATPVVVSDITGYRAVMTDETGLLVPPGDPDALVGAVTDLLANEPRRQQLGGCARRLAQERYSWDDIARRLSAIYEGLT